MINILYIIQYLGHGGTEKQLVQLIRGLEGRSVRPHLCTLTPSEGLFDELSVPKMYLHFRSFLHPSLVRNLQQLSSFIRHHNIHIVQTFSQDPFLLAAMLKPWHSFKLIGSFRDLGFWRTPVALGKMRLAYPFFDGFIANSHVVKDFFAHADRLCADNIEVIHNGIEITEGREALVDVDGNHTPVIGIVANCNRPVKRVDDFIRTAHLVHRKLQETRFIVVGDGEMRQELQQLSRSLGLEEVLTFTGRVTNPLDFVRRFDVGVITSETEGLCNAILEYMAFGVPVVATAAGGNPELVKDGENGYLLPIGDVGQMAEKICLLLQNKPLHSRIHSANLQKVSDDFSLSRMLAKHEAFYERILGG